MAYMGAIGWIKETTRVNNLVILTQNTYVDLQLENNSKNVTSIVNMSILSIAIL